MTDKEQAPVAAAYNVKTECDTHIKNVESFPTPKTELGRKLLEYRRASIAKGMKTLSADEIDVYFN